jgi:hypothetical protein
MAKLGLAELAEKEAVNLNPWPKGRGVVALEASADQRLDPHLDCNATGLIEEAGLANSGRAADEGHG